MDFNYLLHCFKCQNISDSDLHEISTYLQKMADGLNLLPHKKFILQEDLDDASSDELLALITKVFAEIQKEHLPQSETSFLKEKKKML